MGLYVLNSCTVYISLYPYIPVHIQNNVQVPTLHYSVQDSTCKQHFQMFLRVLTSLQPSGYILKCIIDGTYKQVRVPAHYFSHSVLVIEPASTLNVRWIKNMLLSFCYKVSRLVFGFEASIIYLPYFLIQLPRQLFFFEFIQ